MTTVPKMERLTSPARDAAALRDQVQHWLADRVVGPVVSELEIVPGNGGSATVLFDVAYFDAGVRRAQSCVLRLPPEPHDDPVFPVYDMARQYKAMELVGRRTSVPVPSPLWLETDTSYFGMPFYVTRRVEGQVVAGDVPYTFGDNWLADADADARQRLQNSTIAVLAGIHSIAAEKPATPQHPGRTALRLHVQSQREYYRWVVRDGVRVPLIEQGFDWLIANWPKEPPAVVSWGDAQVGNIIYRDFEPVAVLDWELVGLGPRELDLGWLVHQHRVAQDRAEQTGRPGLPDFLVLEDVVAEYARLTGYQPDSMRFYVGYAALRHAIILTRITRRQVRFGEASMPADPNHTFAHHEAFAAMLDGTYWRKLW